MLMAGSEFVAGVDEAGRGPLAGPVVAAAVVLDPHCTVGGLRDSKQLSEVRRDALAAQVCERAVAWSVASVGVEEIDRLNILQATLLAMRQAVESLGVRPAEVLIDGNRCPVLAVPARAVVGGDRTVAAISAASILAKVERDRAMRVLDVTYPGYGFARHKGYPTRAHREALVALGPTPVHRRTFAPVRLALMARANAGSG
jgi:ribonuclease HII